MSYGRRSNIQEVVGAHILGILGDDESAVGSLLDSLGAAVANPTSNAPAKSWRNGGSVSNKPQFDLSVLNHPLVKAAIMNAQPAGTQSVNIATRPNWRDGEAAPGVMLPDEGMVPLGMTPDNGTGTFTATGAAKITWVGRMQKPYRAERLLVSVVRTGTTATGRLLGQFFVGVDLNQGTLQAVDIELFGAANAFGTRLTLLQAPPGVELSVPVTLSAYPTTTDTVFGTIQWAGRIVH